MIQPVNSCILSPENQLAENLCQPAQSFQEVLGKRRFSDDKKTVNHSTVGLENHPAKSLHPPAPSPEAGLQKQAVSEEKNEEKNKEVEPRAAAATFLLNPPPILPNLCVGDNSSKVDPSEIQSAGQPLNPPASMIQNQPAFSILSLAGRAENPELNRVPFTMAQTKPDSSASANSLAPDIASIFNGQENDLQAGFLPTVSEGQENPIFLTGTTSQNTPWAMRSEATRSSSSKSELNASLLGQRIMLPGVSADSLMLLEYDEKLNFLLGQNSKGGELPGRSLNDEFSGLGNSSAEKNGPNVNSRGENQPTQDPFDLKGILGGPKLSTVVEETVTLQKPQLSKTGHVDLYQQIAEKVIWSIKNNTERIRLRLDPPQMGNLLIELHRDKDEIKATLWADNPKTKEIFENNQFQLQKTLEEHGFKLEKYDVFLQNETGSFQGKGEEPGFHGTGRPEKSLPIHEAELNPGIEILPAAIPMVGASQYIDRFI